MNSLVVWLEPKGPWYLVLLCWMLCIRCLCDIWRCISDIIPRRCRKDHDNLQEGVTVPVGSPELPCITCLPCSLVLSQSPLANSVRVLFRCPSGCSVSFIGCSSRLVVHPHPLVSGELFVSSAPGVSLEVVPPFPPFALLADPVTLFPPCHCLLPVAPLGVLPLFLGNRSVSSQTDFACDSPAPSRFSSNNRRDPIRGDLLTLKLMLKKKEGRPLAHIA